MLTRPAITATIIGPRTVEQFQDNLGELDVRLGPSAQERLSGASTFAASLPRT